MFYVSWESQFSNQEPSYAGKIKTPEEYDEEIPNTALPLLVSKLARLEDLKSYHDEESENERQKYLNGKI